MEALTRETALSRSAFFALPAQAGCRVNWHFMRSWRMAMAKDPLRRGASSTSGVVELTGHSSARRSAQGTSTHRAAGVPVPLT